MRVTGIGHAGMRFETAGGSVLCDPWTNPTFFASWVPFPDNTGSTGRARALRLPLRLAPAPRPLRRGEPARSTSPRTRGCCCPTSPPTSSRTSCASWASATSCAPVRASRRSSTAACASWSPRSRARATARSATRRSPSTTAPPASSTRTTRTRSTSRSCWSSAPTTRTSPSSPARSGGRWSTTCPKAAKREFARRKRIGQEDRAMRYIREVGAPQRLPHRGPALLPRRRAVPLERPGLRGRRGRVDLHRPVGVPRAGCASWATTGGPPAAAGHHARDRRPDGPRPHAPAFPTTRSSASSSGRSSTCASSPSVPAR